MVRREKRRKGCVGECMDYRGRKGGGRMVSVGEERDERRQTGCY